LIHADAIILWENLLTAHCDCDTLTPPRDNANITDHENTKSRKNAEDSTASDSGTHFFVIFVIH
jgi:hypothetical protein